MSDLHLIGALPLWGVAVIALAVLALLVQHFIRLATHHGRQCIPVEPVD